MIRCQRFLVFLSFIAILAAGPALGDAVFWAPETVQADGAGEFSFTALLIAGEGCEGWTGYGYGGVANVIGGEWADTFCIDPQPIAPGVSFTIEVQGRLADPARGGTVFAESSFCTGGGGHVETTVLAPSVPNASESWGGIKARYR